MVAQIETLQEMFNKKLKDEKNKNIKINSTIFEKKNILEIINSRITEAEGISEVEDRVVEITATEKNKEKIMKRNEDGKRPLGQHSTYQHSYHSGSKRRKERKGQKNFEDIITKIFLICKRKHSLKFRKHSQYHTG